MKRLYVGSVRAVRQLLIATAAISLLDRWAVRSRVGLWVRSWFAIYDLEDMVRIGVPWWTFRSVDLVERHLATHPGARVLEWGSGVSTLWLAARAAEVTSVEHDPDWADQMRPLLPVNARIVLVPSRRVEQPRIPSAKRGFEGQDFNDYVAAIDGVPGLFDLVVIDGRAREKCLERAVARLSPHGMLVFDNVDRRRYREAIRRLGERVSVMWTRGLTPSLPYPTGTALLSLVGPDPDAVG